MWANTEHACPEVGVSEFKVQRPVKGAGRIVVISAGVSDAIRAAVRIVCDRTSNFEYRGQASSTDALLRAYTKQAPHIIVIDSRWVGGCDLQALVRLHRALPSVRGLLVGDSLDLSTISRVLRMGVWGVLTRERASDDLEHAMHAVTQGELWLSRSQLSNLIMDTAAEVSYMDLPQLTPRENTVVRSVLLGCSNKEIACMLDIAEHTVAIHLHNIYSKLHLHRRIDLLIRHRPEMGARVPSPEPLA